MSEVVNVKTVLNRTTFHKRDLDALLDPREPSWVKFDPEFGYVPSDFVMQDGMDDSWTTYRYESGGHRKLINYADRPCRINTFGDSYTQCQQVSDGETWQEVLAAHIGEPIRNFGCGGQSVYFACKRAKRMDATDASAEYIILNIFDDDHVRSLDACRWIRSAYTNWWELATPKVPIQLNGLPSSHVRYNLKEARFEERAGVCPDEDALRALCAPDRFYATFKDDPIIKMFTIMMDGETDVEELEALAEALEVEVDLRDPKKRKDDVRKLCDVYGFKASEFILDDFKKWAAENGRKLLILLTYYKFPVGRSILKGEPRADQCFIDYLDRNGFCYVDTAAKFAEDSKRYNVPFEQYEESFRVKPKGAAVFGHYTPVGNAFYAFTFKDEVVDWLDPKPPAYRGSPSVLGPDA